MKTTPRHLAKRRTLATITAEWAASRGRLDPESRRSGRHAVDRVPEPTNRSLRATGASVSP
ncbi:hypothetical protein ACFWGP_05495 [Agromyces sp. NPDC127015]|uniref:hypothetical protein n=1 Tax=Agromyces sp. NPDC127015 TaxID=3347108 RepID=UPI003653064F